nr:ribonuclease H-like domain-containing protein [Tanacetum cinerariifolium]
VEETLHIRFQENAPNVKGNGPDWLFDIDSLKIFMNYVPVVFGNQTNGIAGSKENLVACQDDKKKELKQEYILIPICTTDPLISQGTTDSTVDAGKKAPEVDGSEALDNGGKNDQVPRIHLLILLDHHLLMMLHKHQLMLLDLLKDSPVARIEAIRLFLAYASFKDFIVYQMDVKSTFLYGEIEEEVYVCQPPGFEDPNFPNKVYKVEKALYGLHQAPRACIRPNITFVVCACARFQVNSKTSHLHAVKRIFRYLKGQPKLGLWYLKDLPFDLDAYSDSDYARASLDRKSTTGGC